MPTQPLTLSQKRQLIEALLECRIMQTDEDRNQVKTQLPAKIFNRIKHAGDNISAVNNILEGCLYYPDGLQNLLEAVNFHEKGSLPFQKVLQVVNQFAPPPEPQPKRDPPTWERVKKLLRLPVWKIIASFAVIIVLAGIIVLWLFPVIRASLFTASRPKPAQPATTVTITSELSPSETRSPAATETSPTLQATPSPSPVPTPAPTVTSPVASDLATKDSSRDGMRQVLIPGGEYSVGRSNAEPGVEEDETPQRKAAVEAFWFDQTEVTNAMFTRFIDETHYQTSAEGWGGSWVFTTSLSTESNPGLWVFIQGASWRYPLGPDSSLARLEHHPVVQVSWFDAAAYCEWAGRRLPTEVEWEIAARGNTNHLYPWGDQRPSALLANFADKNLPAGWADPSADDGYTFTSPVGNYPQGASPFGILDLSGNVWEWVSDWYDQGDYDGSPRVSKGGSWEESEDDLRATRRVSVHPDTANNSHGFRCAQSTRLANEWIAFASDKPGNEDIFMINSDGTGLDRLTDDPASDTGASWSPDANKIAFTSNRDGIFRVYVMDETGDNQTLLLQDVPGEAPTWSPDGEWIAFNSSAHGDDDIYKVRVSGAELTQLTTGEADDVDPVWSPDGKKILFLSYRDGGEQRFSDLYILDPNIGEDSVQRLTFSEAYEGYAVWSPDSQHILFISDKDGPRNIYQMNADGSNQERVTGVDYDNNPSFAPDGRRFVFDSSINNRQVLLASLDGDEPQQIQTGLSKGWLPSWSPVPGDERILFTGLFNGDREIYTWREDRNYALRLTNNQSYEIQPRLSPDGEWIAFATNRDGDGSLYRICLTPARFPSEEWTCLTEANVDSRYPAWSPDGQRLVFASKSDGSWDIFVMDRDGTNLEKLVDHPANDRMPGWSADGTIFFVSDRSGGGDIYKMDADGRNLGLVFDKPGYDASPMASPDGSILAYASSGANDSYHTRIYLYHLKSGDIELLTDWSGTSNNYPIWSKDGQILYFTSTLYWGTRDIWRMDLDDKDHADNLTEDWREDTFGGP